MPKKRVVKLFKRNKRTKRVSIFRQFHKGNMFRHYKCIISGFIDSAILGAAGNQGWNFSLNAVGALVTNAGTQSGLGQPGPVGAVTTKMTQLEAIFDTYRVLGMRVTFNPSSQDSALGATAANQTIFMLPDYDDLNTLIASDSLSCENGIQPKQIALGKPISKFMKNPDKTWHNTSVPPLVRNNTLTNTTAALQGRTLTPTYFASIKCFMSGLESTVAYGRFYIQWYVEYKGFSTTV